MRKCIPFLLVFLLLVCCALSSSLAESAGSGREVESGNYTYTLQDDDTWMITGYKGQEATLVIPSELEGIAITAIGPSAFVSNNNIIDVTIPEGIVSLGDYAFQRCDSLQFVNLPASLVEVGPNPFAGCESLLEIEVEAHNPNLAVIDGVLYSVNDARLIYYSMMKEDEEFTLKRGIRIIGASAFYECDHIKRINIKPKSGDSSLIAIGRRAFYKCEKLEAIDLEYSQISTVGTEAFSGCKKLKKLSFPSKVTSIADRAFEGCSSLKELVLPETITTIGEMAFQNCSSLTAVKLPEGVTTVGKNTFAKPYLSYKRVVKGLVRRQTMTYTAKKNAPPVVPRSSETNSTNIRIVP